MPMSFGDKQREAWARWVGKPPGLTPDLVDLFMGRIHAGRTIRDLTNASGADYVCSTDRFDVHAQAQPEWAAEMRRQSKVNSDIKKRTTNSKAAATVEFCLKGLHRMEGDNLRVWASSGRRQCKACQRLLEAQPNLDRILPIVDKVTRDLQRGVGVVALLEKYNIHKRIFYGLRRVNPDFDRVARDALQNKGVRQQFRAVQVQIANTRSQNDDYHAIRSMIPENNPHRDDIVARIFEDILSGALKREDVPARVKDYIAEMNKLFPTKWRKFGDALLYSLDAPVYEDGSATQHDMVSEGLWS